MTADDGAESSKEQGAWLETPGRDSIQIQGNCSIGRSAKNTMVLDSPKISRRHAIINVQNVGEFWLIDLGSSNGTFLNKRRVHQPVRLCDQDQIIIGDFVFMFRQPIEVTGEYQTTLIERTIREIENVACWRLLAYIENITPLSRSLTTDKLATKNVADTLVPLKQAQAKNEPRFRLALHFGPVAIGGVPSMGEESLMGKDVNFVFRMEKLAGSLGISLLTSAAGKDKLGALIKCEPAGAHELKGFEGKHEFYSC